MLLIVVQRYSQAQIHISTSMRSDFVWNSNRNEWVWVSDDENEKTFFEINRDFTLIKHTTPSLTSTYIIKSSEEDKEKNQWEFSITSDVGNDYLMILDIKNNNVRFIGKTKEGNLFLVKHTIKQMWTDK